MSLSVNQRKDQSHRKIGFDLFKVVGVMVGSVYIAGTFGNMFGSPWTTIGVIIGIAFGAALLVYEAYH